MAGGAIDARSGAAELENPPPVAPVAPVSTLAESLLRQYLLAVATLGGYLVVRTYLLARRLDEAGRRSRTRALTWAFAVLFAPAACLTLFEVARLARVELVALGGRAPRRSLLFAPALYLAIGLALLASRLSGLWAPLLLLFPIPFIVVQAEVNLLEARRAEMVGSPGLSVAQGPRWLLLGLLLPATVFALYKWDRQAITTLRTSRRLAAGDVVGGGKAVYAVRVPDRGWERVGPGVVGDGTEDFGLRKRRGELWVVVYTRPSVETSIDSMVATRRGFVSNDGGKLQNIEEQRFFIEGADLVPVSLTRYRVKYSRRAASYFASAAIFGEVAVEVIGYAFGSPDAEDEVRKLVGSLRPGVGRS